MFDIMTDASGYVGKQVELVQLTLLGQALRANRVETLCNVGRVSLVVVRDVLVKRLDLVEEGDDALVRDWAIVEDSLLGKDIHAECRQLVAVGVVSQLKDIKAPAGTVLQNIPCFIRELQCFYDCFNADLFHTHGLTNFCCKGSLHQGQHLVLRGRVERVSFFELWVLVLVSCHLLGVVGGSPS